MNVNDFLWRHSGDGKDKEKTEVDDVEKQWNKCGAERIIDFRGVREWIKVLFMYYSYTLEISVDSCAMNKRPFILSNSICINSKI